MDYNKIEDAVKKRIIAPATTEIKNIEISSNFTDYTFYTEDGNYLHFEFQTTDKDRDLKRFLFYDASLVYRDNKKVDTIVVYSSEIDSANTCIDVGSIKYSIEAFYMKSIDGDIIFDQLRSKVAKGENLIDIEMLSLTFVPLMNSKRSKSDRAIDSIKLASKIKDSNNKLESLSMLYALLDKFGDENIKKSIWEVFNMTEIGKLIREQGIREGKEEGLKEGKIETLLKLLLKKFGKVPEEYKENIKNLSTDTIDIISLEIFDMKDIKEIEKFF